MPVRSQLPELLQAGITVKFDDANRSIPAMDEKIFGTKKIDTASYTEASVTGLGLLRKKDEKAPISFDDIQRGRQTKFTPDSFALGFEISREMMEDNQVDLMKKMSAELGRSAAESVLYSAFLVLGRGFGAVTAGSTYPTNSAGSSNDTSGTTQTYKGADGVSLFSASHPIAGSPAWTTANYGMPTTYSNTLGGVALSETALQSALQRLDLMPNERGRPMKKKAKYLVVPTRLRLTAAQLLNSSSTLVTSPAYNSGVKNLIAGENLELISCPYLIDPDDWFVVADDSAEYMLKIDRDLKSPLEFDYDMIKKSHLVSIFRRWAFGWTNPRSIVGSYGD